MRVIFQIFVFIFGIQACQTVQLKSMIFDKPRCKDPEKEVWTDYSFQFSWSKGKVDIKQEMEKIYSADLSSMPSSTLREWRLELGPYESGMPNVQKFPAPVREAASKLLSMQNCINPEAKQMSDRHLAFIEKVIAEIPLAIAREEERRKETMAREMDQEKRECDQEKEFAKKRGLIATCGLPLSNMIRGILRNEVAEPDMRKSIVSINFSNWNNAEAFQALADRALFMVERENFIIMVKGRGIIQGQKLQDLSSEFVYEGITQYESNFGPRQAFVFSILRR